MTSYPSAQRGAYGELWDATVGSTVITYVR